MGSLGAALALATVVIAGCGHISDALAPGQVCANPPGLTRGGGGDDRDPFAVGEPFAGRDVTTMTPDQVAEIGRSAGLALTWRFMYGIGDVGSGDLFSECWCTTPPPGRVVGLAFDTGERLVIFVEAAQRLPGARAQPLYGWGCDERGQPV